MRYLAVVLFALLAGACAQPGGLFSDSNLVCSNLGYTQGTPEFGTCVFQNEQVKSARAAGLSAAGAQMQQMGRPYAIQQPGFQCIQQGNYTRCW